MIKTRVLNDPTLKASDVYLSEVNSVRDGMGEYIDIFVFFAWLLHRVD